MHLQRYLFNAESQRLDLELVRHFSHPALAQNLNERLAPLVIVKALLYSSSSELVGGHTCPHSHREGVRLA